jgi:hypothetical protein
MTSIEVTTIFKLRKGSAPCQMFKLKDTVHFVHKWGRKHYTKAGIEFIAKELGIKPNFKLLKKNEKKTKAAHKNTK